MTMDRVLMLLLLNGVLGAVDTLWYHEWKAKLPSRGGPLRLELVLHAGRDAVYAVIYGTLGWAAWTGKATLVLAALIGLEIVITLADFVVEDRLRPAIGGLAAGERVLHSLMAIVYGAMLADLLPALLAWSRLESGLVPHEQLGERPPLWVSLTATAFGIGIAVSGCRDALAVCRTRAGSSTAPARDVVVPYTDRTARAESPSSSSPLSPVNPASAARRPKLTT